MPEPRLDPIVDTRAPSLGRVRKRIVLATGVLLGAAGTAAVMHATLAGEPPSASSIVVPPATTVTVPPPIVVHIEQAAPAPAPPPELLGCPAIEREDLPIGASVTLARGGSESELDHQVVAATNAKQIAIRIEDRIWVSDDDGRSFHELFADRATDAIAIDRDGVLYAASQGELGVRALGGKLTWRSRVNLEPEFNCPDCKPLLTTLGREVVWVEDTEASYSADGGRTWKRIDASEYRWSYGGRLLPWQGSLYQVAQYVDRCGVDDTHVHRLDRDHRVSHAIFTNYFNAGGPVLVADSDTAATWTWRERCWIEPESTESPKRVGACATKDATRATLLTAGRLEPIEGARTLALWGGALIELCNKGARQVARSFPFDLIDAVDAVGRPLVLHDRVLYRWSPVHGWRRLFVAPDKPAD